MLDTHCVHFFFGRLFQLQGPHQDGKLFQRPLSETFQQKCGSFWMWINVNLNPTSLEVKADPKSETQLSCHLKKYPESSLLCQVTFSKLYNKRTSPDKAAQHTGPIPDVFLASVKHKEISQLRNDPPFFWGGEKWILNLNSGDLVGFAFLNPPFFPTFALEVWEENQRWF